MLTLKVMKRHPTAPQEPPKFMGHGICETFSKSIPIIEASGVATNDGAIIGSQAWKALASFNFDPTELRGLGLQATKLEELNGKAVGSSLETGQTKLNFQRGPEAGRTSPGSPSPFTKTEADSEMMLLDDPAFMANMSHLPSAVDLAFLEALPADIRAEVEADIRANDSGATGSKTMLPRSRTPVTPERTARKLVVDLTESPNPSPTKGLDIKHISKQLRPKAITTVSPQKKSLFLSRDAITVKDEELRKLGIDKDVFLALPVQLQKEQLDAARAIRMGKDLTVVPVYKSRFTRSPSAAVPRSLPMVARFAEQPELSRLVPSKTGVGREIMKLKDANDVQQHLKRWVVETHKKQEAPLEEDMRLLTGWLMACATTPGTETGLEKATVVMQWWRWLLRKYWEAQETAASEEGEPSSSHVAGRLWWQGFRAAKAQLDEVVKSKFGGELML